MSIINNKNLNEARNELIKEISSLSYDQFNASPGMNNWSIAQVCHHLVLVELVTIKAIKLGLKQDDRTQNERKNVQLMLDRTKKYKAPEIVEPNSEPFEVQFIIDSLNDSRGKFLTFLSTIEDQAKLAEKSFMHPLLGELPLDQWIEQIYLHEQRHTEQIKEIKLLLDEKQ